MTIFERDLAEAEKFHGHLCAGIVFGVRIARAGLDYLGIEDPSKNRDFMGIVEIDRCLSDAVQSVTGLSLGRRRLKWKDYGKMAAGFIDMNTGKGVRITINPNIKEDKNMKPVDFWKKVPPEELLILTPITVNIPPEDMPGKPLSSTNCEKCGEKIMDKRECIVNMKILCRACADGAYYSDGSM